MHQYKKTYLIMTCFQFQAWSIWFIFIRVEGNVFFPFFFPCFLASRKHQNTVGNFTEIPTCEKQKKKIVKTHAKESNHTHKTIFTWFSNLPTSTELQGFHYYQEKVQSVATDILTLKNTATPPLKTLITKVGLYIYKTGPKIFRPKPPLHGLSLSKSPVKKPLNIIRVELDCRTRSNKTRLHKTQQLKPTQNSSKSQLYIYKQVTLK